MITNNTFSTNMLENFKRLLIVTIAHAHGNLLIHESQECWLLTIKKKKVSLLALRLHHKKSINIIAK